MRQHREEEWQALLRERDAALARSQRIQEQISDSIRLRRPPPMQLMRAADSAESALAAVRARIRDFLHQLG